MTDGDLLARLLPLVLQRYDVSDFEADVLQNARRERRAQRLKAKRFKRFSQRKAISIILLARLWCFINFSYVTFVEEDMVMQLSFTLHKFLTECITV